MEGSPSEEPGPKPPVTEGSRTEGSTPGQAPTAPASDSTCHSNPSPASASASSEVEGEVEGEKKSIADRALVLHLSGWWPAFTVAFVLCSSLMLHEGIRVVLTIGLSAASLCAGLFTLIVGPFLGSWRASARGEGGHLIRSAVLCLGLIPWTVLSLTGLLIGTAIIVAWNGHPPNPADELLPGLDRIIDGVPTATLGLAWLAGLAACLIGREMVRDEVVVYSGGSRWRQALSVLLLLPYLWACQMVLSAVWEGSRLDPDLRRAYETDIAAMLRHGTDAQEAAVVDLLPVGFREDPVVQVWLAKKSSSPAKRNAVLKLWCEQAATLWTGDEFWNRPPLVALSQLARSREIIERSDLKPALRGEVAVRSEVVLIEHGGVSVTQSQRLYDMTLPAETWAKLVDLGLSRTDLLQAAALDDRDVHDRFVQAAARVLARGDYDLDGNLQRHSLERCAERQHLNALWQSYQAGKPYPVADHPLSRKEFDNRYASSLAFNLSTADSDITQVTYSEEVARQALAYDIVLMELKRLEALGAPLPRSWAEFRPEVRAVGEAYRDWILLAANPNGVTLRRQQPRHGTGLTHSFVQSR